MPRGDNAGRPRKMLTPEQLSQIEGLAALLNMDQMADYFGMARSTFQEVIKRDPEISGMYARGRSKAVASVAQGLLAQARDGNTQASMFYLKTQAGWKDTQAIEHSGPDGGAIKHEIGTDAAFAELASLMGGAFARTQSGGNGPDGVA